jgi:hypothetical protein
MNYELLSEQQPPGMYANDQLSSINVGDAIRVQHSNGLYFAEVIAIETGDVGELLVFKYIKPQPELLEAPLIKLNRPFVAG